VKNTPGCDLDRAGLIQDRPPLVMAAFHLQALEISALCCRRTFRNPG
jgi:hypothetical protein